MLPRGYRSESESTSSRRKRQIDTLKIFNDKVTDIKEDVEYKVDFIAGGNNMAIFVSLTQDFPLDKPVLKIQPPINHPWVNDKSEITEAPGLLNFSVHSDLGRVVQAIIRDFERKPPPLVCNHPNNMTILPTLVNGTSSSAYSKYTYRESGHNAQLRVQPTTFPELETFTMEELNELNEDEDRLNCFVDELPLTTKMNKAVDDLMTKNEELARQNLSKEIKLRTLREEVAEKQCGVQVQKKSYELASQRYQVLCDNYSPDNIKECLRLAARRSDEESETIAEGFLNKETGVDAFLEEYIQQRMLTHLRRTKEEKLSSQLNELHKAGY